VSGVPAVPDALTTGIDRDARRALVEATLAPALEGIDFVEVLTNHRGTPGYVPGAPQQRTLAVHLLRGPVPVGLGAGPANPRVLVLGGVRPDPRTNPVRVEWAYPAVALVGDASTGPTDPLPGVTDADRTLVAAAVPAPVRARVLVVRTTSSGDWSTYVLKLTGDGGDGVPDGFDEPLAQAPFAFTVDCPSDLDCRPPTGCPPRPGASPVLDYLARDDGALRTRLLDRLATLLPAWTDRSPADVGVALVELFAYLGDRLSYRQDATAAEAYLGTARRRTSVRRHARLLDYRVHEGCAARTWLAFTTDAVVDLPAGTAAADSTGAPPPGTGPLTALQASEQGALVFETCAPLTATPARNRLPLHSWGASEYCLPAGSTAAFVALAPGGADPALAVGDVLVLAELGPLGTPDSGDPAHRFAVRLDRDPVEHVDPLSPTSRVLELHWHGDDALPGPLQVSRRDADGAPEIAAVVCANVALADHGATVRAEPLDPPQVPLHGTYRPRLARTGLAFADPTGPAPDAAAAGSASATAALRPDPRLAVAQLELDDGARTWQPRPDLLGSGRAPHLVVEPEPSGPVRLRFGDNVTGRRPTPGAVFTAWYRVGAGSAGNAGSGALTTLLRLPDGSTLAGVHVTNPLPGAGGTDPEPLSEVRELAPHAFRTQLRAVTSADYAAVAMADTAVQRAVGRRRWTGSWYAQEVTLDPVGARATDQTVPARIGRLLEVRRMAGVDVELAAPVAVTLEIRVAVCVAPGYLRAEVEGQLRDLLSARTLPDGRRGFFHPDNLTFGQSVFLSDLVATAMAVPGVTLVEVTRFCRAGASDADTRAALARGRLDAAAREVLHCDSDPSAPESGLVELVLGGGS
jgi:hypothetical protein